MLEQFTQNEPDIPDDLSPETYLEIQVLYIILHNMTRGSYRLYVIINSGTVYVHIHVMLPTTCYAVLYFIQYNIVTFTSSIHMLTVTLNPYPGIYILLLLLCKLLHICMYVCLYVCTWYLNYITK